ncbi:MAG: aminopeptidase [Gammaproteobacteria bacterium]|nr:aminopeptidase [Gammaproteobacteria bacterium]
MMTNSGRLLTLVLLVNFFTGCSTVGFYHQSTAGHLALLAKQEPIADIVNDSTRDKKLIEQLVLAQELRTFASTDLMLPENESYRSYIQLERRYVAWHVFAAPEFSVTLQKWCFLAVDCMQYRRYFDKHKARAYAAKLAATGQDVYVAGVPAYSTLAPLVSSMLNQGEIATASYIFHELAHQQLYVHSNSTFNESFATAVEELGIRHWLQQQGRQDELLRYENWLTQKAAFANLILDTRQEFHELYESGLPVEMMRSEKQKLISILQQRFENLKQSNNLLQRYEKWMLGPLNNAQLGVIAVYRDQVPFFKQLFLACGSDFEKFYLRSEEISKLTAKERQSALEVSQQC